MRTAIWLSGFFLGSAVALTLFILTGFTPSSYSWGGVIFRVILGSALLGGLLLLAGRKQ